MLPLWIIEKRKKEKNNFIQEQLYIEELPIIEKPKEIEQKEERGVIIIELF
jgi:hypothetical protein